jgi:hypothetical protein
MICAFNAVLRIFARQSVERAALHLGFSLVQRGENLRGQRIGVQPLSQSLISVSTRPDLAGSAFLDWRRMPRMPARRR